jgi:hypothetical protein
MSESFDIELGNPLPLSLTLPDGASGLFPQAFVYDSADSPVAGSPFDLSEIGTTGRYTNAGFTPLVIGTFTAHFVVFSDGAHLIEATTYERDQDSYVVRLLVANAVWNELNRGADHNIQNSTGKQQRQAAGGFESQDVVSATANTVELQAAESSDENFFIHRRIAIVVGPGINQIRVIESYDGTTKIATLSRAWDVVPTVDSDYLVLLSSETLDSGGRIDAQPILLDNGDVEVTMVLRRGNEAVTDSTSASLTLRDNANNDVVPLTTINAPPNSHGGYVFTVTPNPAIAQGPYTALLSITDPIGTVSGQVDIIGAP